MKEVRKNYINWLEGLRGLPCVFFKLFITFVKFLIFCFEFFQPQWAFKIENRCNFIICLDSILNSRKFISLAICLQKFSENGSNQRYFQFSGFWKRFWTRTRGQLWRRFWRCPAIFASNSQWRDDHVWNYW